MLRLSDVKSTGRLTESSEMVESIGYRDLSKWKYQLMEDYSVRIPIIGFNYRGGWVELDPEGRLIVRKGYSWDGPSGPTWDTKSAMRPSLVHDVLYQLMRMGAVPIDRRPMVDSLFHIQLIEDGMGKFRAWYFWRAVKAFGKSAAAAKEVRYIKRAP